MTNKELLARRAKLEREFEVARGAAEMIANEENEALASDDSYVAWTRKKKLAELEVARLERGLEVAADDIEAEIGRRERDAFLKHYNEVKARNFELQARIKTVSTTIIPELLKLIADLAQDELDVEEINRKVPYGSGLRLADSAVRSRPSQAETILSDEIVEFWCDRAGHQLPFQEAVLVDASGAGSISADFGQRRIECFKRKFRRIERLAFTPAADAIPLWKEFAIPRFDQIVAPSYDGKRARSPQHALELLASERRGHPRDKTVEIIPLNRDGQALNTTDLGPAIPS